MFKKNKLNISTIVLFIIYSALVLNWLRQELCVNGKNHSVG